MSASGHRQREQENTERFLYCTVLHLSHHHHIVLGVDGVDRLTYTINKVLGTRLLSSFLLAPSMSTPALAFPRPSIPPYLCVVPYAGYRAHTA